MKGTPTISKAKSLKEKRELAAELGMSYLSIFSPYLDSVNRREVNATDNIDEVREFEAKRGLNKDHEERASRSKDKGRRASVPDDLDEDQDEDEDEDEEPAPKTTVCPSSTQIACG
jgi:hypothetical protein